MIEFEQFTEKQQTKHSTTQWQRYEAEYSEVDLHLTAESSS